MYKVVAPCQDPKYGYEIDGVWVSDFVTPAWFDSSTQPGESRFDFRGHIAAPFTILPGGYAEVFDINSGKGWRTARADP
jgi:hypothetical protein